MPHSLFSILRLGTFALAAYGGSARPLHAEPSIDRSKMSEAELSAPENWPGWADDKVPVLSPEESLSTMRIAPGFEIQLVAAEPMIKDPVFAVFDAKGRLWVCEFQTYMLDVNAGGENETTSRIQVLADTDGDGQMDRATTFVDGLTNPRSICFVGEDGVLVGETGALHLMRDTDGDLVADEREKLVDYATSAFSNIEHAENSLLYGIDNWIYNTKSSRRFRWSGGVFMETRTKARGQWGMSTDAWGRLYSNSNSSWGGADWAIYDQKSNGGAGTREIFTVRENTAINRAYRPGTLRDDLRLASVTTVSGLTSVSDAGFGEEWIDAFFSFSPGGNAVGAFRPQNPAPELSRFDHVSFEDEQWEQREFLASTDERFRPVNGTVGPDGCLYVVDFHRGIIQHKRFLTPFLRTQSEERDLVDPTGLGRIYRIVPEGHEAEPAPPEGDLVAGLQHPYLFWRMDAQRRIVTGDRRDLVGALEELIEDTEAKPKTVAHALWSLHGLGKLSEDSIVSALGHDDWFVQLTALRVADPSANGSTALPPSLADSVGALTQREGVDDVVLNYIERLQNTGYPDRTGYVDKEAKWLKSDEELLSRYREGRVLYSTSCGACHQPSGQGKQMLAPTLAKSDWVTGDPDVLARVVLHGLTGPIEVNGKSVEGIPPVMPPHGFLSDEHIGKILTYIRNAWGNRAEGISTEDVTNIREAHEGRFAMWTAEELGK